MLERHIEHLKWTKNEPKVWPLRFTEDAHVSYVVHSLRLNLLGPLQQHLHDYLRLGGNVSLEVPAKSMTFTVSLIPKHYFLLLGPELSNKAITSARSHHIVETMVEGPGSIDHLFPPTQLTV